MNFIAPLLAEVSAKPDMGFAGMVTFTGIVVVFLVLTALVLIFSVFGKVMSAGGKKKRKKHPLRQLPHLRLLRQRLLPQLPLLQA